MISGRKLSHPLFTFAAVNLTQFLAWAILFPVTPSVEYAESKCIDGRSLAYMGVALLLILLGMYFGVRGAQDMGLQPSAALINRKPRRETFLFAWACVGALAGGLSALYQVVTVASDGSLMAGFLTPFGQHKIAEALREETGGLGLGTTSCVLIGVSGLFAYIGFSPCTERRRARQAKLLVAAVNIVVFVYSTFVMARQLFMVSVLAAVGTVLLIRPIRVKIRYIAGTAVALAVFVWCFATIRTGIIYSEKLNEHPLSTNVQAYVWRELVENYLPGEFNSACIVLSYPADPERNWPYGTMLEKYVRTSYGPNRTINTINSVAIWYWQMGYLALGFGLVVGVATGVLYRKALRYNGSNGLLTTLYALVWTSLIISIRVNAFMIQTFIAPFMFLLTGFLLKSAHAAITWRPISISVHANQTRRT